MQRGEKKKLLKIVMFLKLIGDIRPSQSFKADTLGEILWADTFFYQPQRLVSPVNSPLSQASLSILKEYSKKIFLKF